MATTPDRHNTSVSRIKSPRMHSSPGTIASLRVVEAVARFVEFHRKWKQAVEKGSQVCNVIRNIKKPILQASTNECPYPENLILHCKNLLLMVSIMEDMVTNAAYVVAQLESLKGSFAHSDIIGRTWNFEQTLSVIEMSMLSYKTEVTNRKYIAENIGHAISTDVLALFACSWNTMMDVERYRELRVKMLTFEYQIDE